MVDIKYYQYLFLLASTYQAGGISQWHNNFLTVSQEVILGMTYTRGVPLSETKQNHVCDELGANILAYLTSHSHLFSSVFKG